MMTTLVQPSSDTNRSASRRRFNGLATGSLAALTLAFMGPTALAQSSSLYQQAPRDPAPLLYDADRSASTITRDRLHASARDFSSFAAPAPRPVTYAENDLITIVIRESMQTDMESDLSTESESDFADAVTAFPQLNLSDLLDAQIRGNASTTPLRLGVTSSHEFEGNGEFTRSNSVTGRITGRVVEVLPNGTLVVEARKHVEHDDEVLVVSLTGTCRVQDVTSDNTVLSSQLYGIRLVQETTGELRQATRKGPITRLLEAIFNF